MRRPVLFLEEFRLLLLLSSLLLLLISKLDKHDKFDLVVAHLMSHIAIGDVATPTAPLARSLTAHNAAPHLDKSEKSAEHSLFLGQDGSVGCIGREWCCGMWERDRNRSFPFTRRHMSGSKVVLFWS